MEPDLAKVCIVDNSPMAYILNSGMSPRNLMKWSCFPPNQKSLPFNFLENGIPIEGWISEAGDEALLYLLPFLDALRFTEDVRSVLRLRGGISTRSFWLLLLGDCFLCLSAGYKSCGVAGRNFFSCTKIRGNKKCCMLFFNGHTSIPFHQSSSEHY